MWLSWCEMCALRCAQRIPKPLCIASRWEPICVPPSWIAPMCITRHGPDWPRRTTGGLMHSLFPGRKFIGLSTFDYHVQEGRIAAFYGDAILVSQRGMAPTALSPYRRLPNPYLHNIAMAMKPLWRQLTSHQVWPHLSTQRSGLRANRFESGWMADGLYPLQRQPLHLTRAFVGSWRWPERLAGCCRWTTCDYRVGSGASLCEGQHRSRTSHAACAKQILITMPLLLGHNTSC